MNASQYVDRLFEIISDMSEEEQKILLNGFESREIKKNRKHPRKECLITVNYAIKGRAHQNFIQDISAEGVFIETRESFAVGDKILLTISYSNEQRPFKIEGEVARIDPGGVGIKFKKVSQVQEELINSIIEKTAKNKKVEGSELHYRGLDAIRPVLEKWTDKAMQDQLDRILLNLGEIRAQIQSQELKKEPAEALRSIRQITDEYLGKKSEEEG